MTKAPINLTVGNAESVASETLPSYPASPVADGVAAGEGGMDAGANIGAHALLSRPSLSQGRRSLFRR
jgi:hypothetical protein